ncbi:hypothetical protein TVD_10715 [Thioalkalivibrio versutus]|uniref:Uncharacterized protein n=1 Tax=Thioalkalivibrio versutus TaxID=106634 RepID=A0A0G3G5Z6_9GAMM|nr:hypothetical protein TVD_10715 [Thioalkalivibrio versutus]
MPFLFALLPFMVRARSRNARYPLIFIFRPHAGHMHEKTHRTADFVKIDLLEVLHLMLMISI